MERQEATAFVLGPQGFVEYERQDYDEPEWFAEGEFEVDWKAEPMRDETREVLPQVETLLRRMVPGVAVHVVPRMPPTAAGLVGQAGQAGVRQDGGWGGMAFYDRSAVVLSGDQGPWSLLASALHEAWHLAESRMTAQDRSIARLGLAEGIPLPGEYYDSVDERSARAFESWALYRLSQGPELRMPAFGSEWTRERLYWLVLTGRYRPVPRVVTSVSPPAPGLLHTAALWLARAVRKLVVGTTTAHIGRTA